MQTKNAKSILRTAVNNTVTKKTIHGAVFYLSSDNSPIDAISAAGNLKEDSQYYIASINKLFICAMILKLCREKKLALQDKIFHYLPEDTVQGLHVYKGTDYSKSISITHLLSLTSGLPCYLVDKQRNGKKVMTELEAGIDQAWPIDRVVREIKTMSPHFPPGQGGKARYGDTNHQLLSLIIENITGDPIHVALKKLFQELELANTFVCDETNMDSFVPIYYKSDVLRLPLFLTSTGNDIISNAKDQMTFLKVFFNGHFYAKEKLCELYQWKRIFFPFKYGIGIQLFSLPRILSPFKALPDMMGHSGSVGSVVFYIPERDLYITGTVNQQTKPSAAFQTMINILDKLY